MRTLVGLYDDYNQAKDALHDLLKNGYDESHISMIASHADGEQGSGGFLSGLFGGGGRSNMRHATIQGIGDVTGTGSLLDKTSQGKMSLVDALTNNGVPPDDAQMYAEGLRRGGTLVYLNTLDDADQPALDILERHGPVDIRRRRGIMTEKENWQGFDESRQPLTGDEARNLNVPIVEEDLKVGKREVQTGGVRIHTYKTEEPVQEDINLREENVNVERRPVDRPATDADLNAVKDDTFEINETAEEPVVSKDARVVEELNVNKDFSQRTEHIEDTVQRTHADVEQVGQSSDDFDRLEPRFREHFSRTYAGSNFGYNDYRGAYRFGYDEAGKQDYQNVNWDQVEPVVQNDWTGMDQDTRWSEVKEAVRAGFMARNQA